MNGIDLAIIRAAYHADKKDKEALNDQALKIISLIAAEISFENSAALSDALFCASNLVNASRQRTYSELALLGQDNIAPLQD